MSSTIKKRTEFLRKGKYGFFFHFINHRCDGSGGCLLDPESLKVPERFLCRGNAEWNRLVDSYDVRKIASLMHEFHAGFVYLTVGQNTGYYASPNETYDRLTGLSGEKSLCSRRDLVAELSDALTEYGIPLIVYVTTNAPMWNPEIAEKLHFLRGIPGQHDFIRLWSDIHREWSMRWGKKAAGWWIDGAHETRKVYLPKIDGVSGEKLFADALRSGNPDAAVAYNDPSNIYAEEDFTAKESNFPDWMCFEFDRGPLNEQGKQYHRLGFIGKTWDLKPVSIDVRTMVNATRTVTDNHGAMGWDVPINPDGSISPDICDFLRHFAAAFEQSLKDTPPASVEIVRPARVCENGESQDGLLHIESEKPAVFELQWAGKTCRTPMGNVHDLPLPVFTTRENTFPDRTFNSLFEENWAKGNASVSSGSVTKYFMHCREWRLNLHHLKCSISAYDGVRLGDLEFNLAGTVLEVTGRIFDENPVSADIPWEGSCLEFFFTKNPPWNQICIRPDGKMFLVKWAEGLVQSPSVVEYTDQNSFSRFAKIGEGVYDVNIRIDLSGHPILRQDGTFLFDVQLRCSRNGAIHLGELFSQHMMTKNFAVIVPERQAIPNFTEIPESLRTFQIF